MSIHISIFMQSWIFQLCDMSLFSYFKLLIVLLILINVMVVLLNVRTSHSLESWGINSFFIVLIWPKSVMAMECPNICPHVTLEFPYCVPRSPACLWLWLYPKMYILPVLYMYMFDISSVYSRQLKVLSGFQGLRSSCKWDGSVTIPAGRSHAPVFLSRGHIDAVANPKDDMWS